MSYELKELKKVQFLNVTDKKFSRKNAGLAYLIDMFPKGTQIYFEIDYEHDAMDIIVAIGFELRQFTIEKVKSE